MWSLLLLLSTSTTAHAEEPPPLLDLVGVAYGGLGGVVANGRGIGALGRAGGEVDLWLTPEVSLGVRLDTGAYKVTQGEGNLFAFAQGQVRVDRDVTLGVGIGTPVAWVEYTCVAAPCENGPWERHSPIGVVTATWEYSANHVLIPLTARVEAGGERWGVGVEVGFGFRAWRPAREDQG